MDQFDLLVVLFGSLLAIMTTTAYFIGKIEGLKEADDIYRKAFGWWEE